MSNFLRKIRDGICCGDDDVNIREEKKPYSIAKLMNGHDSVNITEDTPTEKKSKHSIDESYDDADKSGDKNTDKFLSVEKRKKNIKSLTGLFDHVYTLKEKINSDYVTSGRTEPLYNTKAIDVPKILLIGTQTSGKSSVLNNMIGYDILPTGDEMITRTPLHVSLKNGSVGRITLSCIENGNRFTVYEKKIDDFKNFKNGELKKKIQETTDRLTCGPYLISNTPLFLEIVKNDFVDLTIVDLPGIVAMARKDKNQPETIVEDIQNLIEEQIASDNVFVIVVIRAGNDLETDAGLALVKKFSTKYKKMKTMGVVTKVDLVDQKKIKKIDDIILLNNKSDISVDHGYYAINNSIPIEYSADPNSWYVNFFKPKSQVILQKRYGIENIVENLIRNTNQFLQNRVHALKNNLDNMRTSLKTTIPIFGNEGENTKSKLLYIINNCYVLSREISDSINSCGNNCNIGAKIRDIMEDFGKEMLSLNLFNKSNLPDAKLNAIMKSFEGFGSSSQNINLIIHKCFIDKEIDAFNKIKTIFTAYLTKLYDLNVSTFQHFLSLEDFGNTQSFLNQTNIKNYPKITEFMEKNNLLVLQNFRDKATKIISDHITMQTNLKLWCDETDIQEMERDSMNELVNIDMSKSLHEDDTKNVFKSRKSTLALRLFEESTYDVNQIRCLINIIFKRTVIAAKELSVKTIHSTFIVGYNYNLFHHLTDEIKKMENIDELFFTSLDKLKEAKKIESYIDDIDSFMSFINDFESKY